MKIDLVLIWWSIAWPFTLGVLACADLSPALKDHARRLGAYVGAAPFFMKMIYVGVDVQATSAYFLSAVTANLALVVALRYYLSR